RRGRAEGEERVSRRGIDPDRRVEGRVDEHPVARNGGALADEEHPEGHFSDLGIAPREAGGQVAVVGEEAEPLIRRAETDDEALTRGVEPVAVVGRQPVHRNGILRPEHRATRTSPLHYVELARRAVRGRGRHPKLAGPFSRAAPDAFEPTLSVVLARPRGRAVHDDETAVRAWREARDLRERIIHVLLQAHQPLLREEGVEGRHCLAPVASTRAGEEGADGAPLPAHSHERQCVAAPKWPEESGQLLPPEAPRHSHSAATGSKNDHFDSARITCLEAAMAVAHQGQLSNDRGASITHPGPPRLDIVDLDIEPSLYRRNRAPRLDLGQSGTTGRSEDRPTIAVGAIPGPIQLEPQNIAIECDGLVVEGSEVVEAELVHAACPTAWASSLLRCALGSHHVLLERASLRRQSECTRLEQRGGVLRSATMPRPRGPRKGGTCYGA